MKGSVEIAISSGLLLLLGSLAIVDDYVFEVLSELMFQ